MGVEYVRYFALIATGTLKNKSLYITTFIILNPERKYLIRIKCSIL